MTAINLSSSYSQNFNSLLNSGTNNTWTDDSTIDGWYYTRIPTPSSFYNAGNGSSTTGALYSFGSTNATDRALGSVASGTTGTIVYGVRFLNNTANTINSLNISYTGEQWRDGGNATLALQQLDFQYQIGATTINSGNWINFDSLDFISPIATATASSASNLLDGNASANRTTLSSTLSGLSLAPNQEIWLRWQDINDTGNDHGLGIDDFSISAGGVTPPSATTVTIQATDSAAAETASDPGIFRITRTGSTATPLTVNYTVATGAGQATNGTDYTNLTGTATISAGQSFVDITITPADDNTVEGAETVTLTLVDTADYDLGGSSTATVTIADNDVAPTVAIAATDANAAEAGTDPGTFRITRTGGDTTNALSVSYTVATGAGQATNGTDYTPNLTGTATILAGQSFVDITITPVDDLLGEGNETVTLTLAGSANYTLGTATATVTIADNDVGPGNIRIHDIQGAAHISPLNNQAVNNVPGIVTAIASNGFYLQDPNPDNNDATSEGIFVFTSSAPTVSVGNSILVSGTVNEFRPGGSANNLTITQIISPTITTVSTGNPLPAATILGNGGRTIPTTVISNDAVNGNVENAGTVFDPAQDGIDFYESLEGMLVQINNPVTTSPTSVFGTPPNTSEEIWVLADNGVNATSRTARGGSLITASDFNPERIQIDDLNNSLVLPTVDVGAQLSTITGVVNYDFGNYEVLVSTAPTVVQASTLQREVSNLTPGANQLTLATFNVENLDPSDLTFNNLASRIVNNLRSPDILNLEEIQDNNGAINDSVVDANVTLQRLIDAIAAAGGPTYQYRQINPVDDTNGGEPGGNIRVAFLFNPQRVSFVDRPGGTPTSGITVTDVGSDGIPDLSASPGLIDPNNAAFNSSRKPLVGEFLFNGQTVYVIGNHFNSKGGDQPLFGVNQPPTLSSETQRNQQATIVRNFVQNILTINPNANVVVAGDLNDFEFSNPLSILESGGLNTLIETLPANERYTYNFEGNAQTLDQILVSNNLFSRLNGFDAVHINSEFADQDSDHDPVLARFNLINVINGTSGRDTLVGTAFGDRITGGTGGDILTGGAGNNEFVYTSIRDSGDRITDFTTGRDTIVLTQLLDSLVAGGYNGSNAIADGYVQLIQGSTANSTTLQIDQDGPLGSGIFRPFIELDNVSVVALNNTNNFVF